MSGPKCVKVDPTVLRRTRQKNRDVCAQTIAQYRRAFEELQTTAERLRDLGTLLPVTSPSPDRIAQEVDLSFAAPEADGQRAVQKIEAQTAALNRQLSAAEDRIRQTVFDLRQRIRELGQNSQDLEKRKHNLETSMRRSISPNWPQAERMRLESLLQEMLVAAPPISRVDHADSLDTIRALQKAEELVCEVNRHLSDAIQKLEAEVDSTHSRLLGAELRRQTGAVTLLEAALQTAAGASVAPALKRALTPGKIDKLLGELFVLQDHAAWTSIAGKVTSVRTESDEARQRLVYDALLIECSALLKELRHSRAWQREVGEMIDGFAHLQGSDAETMRNELENLLRKGVVVDLAVRKQQLADMVRTEEVRLFREEKRRAVVESLTSLGYEVVDGKMQTALVDAGKLYLQKAGEREYAVEFVVDHELSLIQTELVRFTGAARTSSQQKLRDRESEDSWCSDHAAMMEQLRRRGLESRFRLKIPSGQKAVKVVLHADQGNRRSEAAQVRVAERSKQL